MLDPRKILETAFNEIDNDNIPAKRVVHSAASWLGREVLPHPLSRRVYCGVVIESSVEELFPDWYEGAHIKD